MSKKLHFKSLLLLCGLIVGSLNAWAEDVTLTPGTNGSAATVNGQDAIKVGSSSKGGDMSITVGKNATELKLHAAAWKGVSGLSLNISGATVSPTSISLTADDGISNNSPFTLSGDEDDFEFTITLSDITEETTITFTSSIDKRFVVWGATYTTSGGSTKTLESIAVQTPPTKTTYYAGETFDPAGLVITRNYDTGDPDTYAYGGHESDFSFSPSTSTALTISNKSITISYGGKTTTQDITVSAAPTYTVTWMSNGESYTTTSVTGGQKPAFPTNPTSCDEDESGSKTFYGWSTSEWTGKLDDLTGKTVYTKASDMPTVSAAVTYYAVFCKGGGESVR